MVEDTHGLSRIARRLEAEEGQGSHSSSSDDDESLSVWNEDDDKEVGQADGDSVSFRDHEFDETWKLSDREKVLIVFSEST